jgi:predicted peptidase
MLTTFFRLMGVVGVSLAAMLPVYGANLQALDLKVTGGAELSPAFAPAVRNYQVSVQSDIGAVLIQAKPEQEGAKVTVMVNGQPTDAKQPMLAVLNTGMNKVSIRLQGSDTDDYVLSIQRQDVSAVVASFLKLEFTDPVTQARMPYRLYVPRNMAAGAKYPLVVFLHGGGERGDDNEKTLAANQGGTVWATPEAQAKNPAFVLVPQARAVWNGGFGVTRNPNNEIFLGNVFPIAQDTQTAHQLLMKVLKDHPQIDTSRLYATGLSQGGFGVWAWNLAHPDLFAAVVPIAAGANPAAVAALKNKPIWAFHAEADPVIPVSFSRDSVKALQAAGSAVRYTEYPADTYLHPMAHFSWVPALKNAQMREWLFQQKR